MVSNHPLLQGVVLPSRTWAVSRCEAELADLCTQ